HHSPLTIHHSPFTTHHSPLTIHHSPHTVYWRENGREIVYILLDFPPRNKTLKNIWHSSEAQ
ncbi:MAG: hypothetical protein J7D60_10920, partial [Prosthecochloris sp.]|nr:hypothetical protein [Prosthecochloris sp.]